MLLARTRPPYHQIVICDPTTTFKVPLWPKDLPPVVATDVCILCMCQVDSDGETEFALGKAEEVRTNALPVYEGILKTPGRRIALELIHGTSILEMATGTTETMVRIWTNHRLNPDRVRIGVD